MGSHPWSCTAQYEEPLEQVLLKARHKEFLESVCEDRSEFQSEDAIEDGISEYIEECDADGTCSILDVENVTTNPEDFNYGQSCPLSKESLTALFGTDKPTADTINKNRGGFNSPLYRVYEKLNRGQSCYIVSYENDRPARIHFFGMSYD